MDLLLLPKVVFEEALLPKLGWNDLLRLRRVSTSAKDIVDHYLNLKENSDLAPEIEIDQNGKTFGEFLRMGIPTSRIFINNVSGPSFYEDSGKDGNNFLKQYGPRLKHLRVRQLSYFLSGKEWTFLNSLVSLQTFEASHFGEWDETKVVTLGEILKTLHQRRKLHSQDPEVVRRGPLVPVGFSQLRSLKIGNNKKFEYSTFYNIGIYLERLLQDCLFLQHVLLPFSPREMDPDTLISQVPSGAEELARFPITLAFLIFHESIHRNERLNPQGNLLKVIDLLTLHDSELGLQMSHEFEGPLAFSVFFFKTCYAHGIKLMNVGAFWLHSSDEESREDLGIPVLSLINLHPCALLVDMPNLEKVEIQAISKSAPGVNWPANRREWPVLKTVDITVDSDYSIYFDHYEGNEEDWREERPRIRQSGKDLFQFFFKDVTREALEELRLNFTDNPGRVTVPKTAEIVSACPNLKKLTLINWPGTNKALVKLFEGLTELEEISLECCEGLGNVAFVGSDVGNPVFLKLTKLKKLSLKGLDKMPKITNTLFSLVICHLKLSHLTLTSDTPVKTVNAIGIRSLLEGNFAESIEKFSFHGWSLNEISQEEYKKLGSKFRSHYML